MRQIVPSDKYPSVFFLIGDSDPQAEVASELPPHLRKKIINLLPFQSTGRIGFGGEKERLPPPMRAGEKTKGVCLKKIQSIAEISSLQGRVICNVAIFLEDETSVCAADDRRLTGRNN